jgi:exopolysaccharide biosynthesis protein
MQQLFVLTVKETSAVGFLADIFLNDHEVESILSYTEYDGDFAEVTDPSLITITMPAPTDSPFIFADSGNEFVYDPNFGDGDINHDDFDNSLIELVEVRSNSCKGYMMIVHDPKRIYIGAPNSFGGMGVRLADKIREDGAVGGINGGGFNDPDGQGLGGTPEGLVIMDGIVRWTTGGGWWGDTIIGFDADGILHVGSFSVEEAVDLNMQWAVNFGPALIINGSALPYRASGISPRTAIGQRADGAVLLLVIEGRQGDTLGASMEDLKRIFLEFEAVNAANLDGGSSTMMVYEDKLLIRSASIYGPRHLATSFLVRNTEEY